MKKNTVYYETITPWTVILSFTTANLAIVFIFLYFFSMKFISYLSMVAALLMICFIFFLYWRYIIQIGDTTITFGYYFSGKEEILLNTIEYAEIFIVDRKKFTNRFAINASGPPVFLEGFWLPGALIRLRLNKDYLTRYKLKRKKKVKQLILVSRQPESVLSLLSEKGVPVQSRGLRVTGDLTLSTGRK